MSTLDIVYIVLLVVLLAFSALYSASDMAYSSVNKLRLERSAKKGDRRSKKALRLAEDYDLTIATVLFGNDFVNIFETSLGSVLATDILVNIYSMDPDLSDVISTVIIVAVLLIFGEILPKAVAGAHSYGLSRGLYWFVEGSKWVFYPFVRPMNFLAKKIASPFIEKAPKEDTFASDEELEAMVDEIESEGIIDESQSELLHNSIDFKETSCYEVMTPRVKVYGYDVDEPFEEFLRKPKAFRHSRVVVYKGNLDNVLGYFQVKTVLRMIVRGEKPEIGDVLLPIVSVPRTMELSSAMALMKKSGNHIAVVRDEYGGTEGIITMEDILEELVGEMWDETDSIVDDVRKTDKRNVFLVKGSMNIDDFFERFELDDKAIDEDYSTVSGWINDRLGRFAQAGDTLHYQHIDLAVTKATPYNVIEVKVTTHPKKRSNKK